MVELLLMKCVHLEEEWVVRLPMINDSNETWPKSYKKCKLFYNHAETLLPNNSFHLGVDGFWIHKYDHPHAFDMHGKNSYSYCLSRTCNKGKPDEYVYWVYAFVTFVFIFPTGLQLPIYVYPLKATQVNVTKSDKELKQECELTAFYS